MPPAVGTPAPDAAAAAALGGTAPAIEIPRPLSFVIALRLKRLA
jgi:hypothetical protein